MTRPSLGPCHFLFGIDGSTVPLRHSQKFNKVTIGLVIMILKSSTFLLCALLGGLAALTSCSAESKATSAIQRGEQLLKEGKRDEAIINFKRAIQLKANSGDAYYGLGRALLLENMPDAYSNLSRAAELLPERPDIKSTLGDATLALYLSTPSRPTQLRERLMKISDDLAKASPPPSDLFRFRAYVQLSDKRPAEAVQTLKQGLQTNPDDQRSQLALVKALLEDKKEEEAESTALQIISKHKGYFPVYDLMSGHYIKDPATFAKAERFLRLKAEGNPHSADVLLGLARYYRLQKNVDGMLTTLAPLLKDQEHFPRGPLLVADFYAETAAYGPAETTLREAIGSRPTIKKEGQIRLAKILYLNKRGEEAFTLADQLAKDHPGDRDIVLLRAQLSERALRADQYDTVLSEIQTLLAKSPNDLDLRHEHGKVLLVKGDTDNAAKEFEQVSKADPARPEARLALVNIYLEKRNFTQAVSEVNRLVEMYPVNPNYRLLRVTCLRSQGNLGEAREALTTLASEYPQQPRILREMALLHLAEGKAPQAEAILRRLFQSERPRIDDLQALAYALVAQKRVDQAMDLLRSIQVKYPSPAVEGIIADVSASVGKFDQTVKSYAALDKESKLDATALGKYAEALQWTGDLKQAIAVARRAQALAPQNPQRNAFLAFLLQISGETEEAIALYRSVVKAQPANLETANNLAYLLADMGKDLPEANQLASKCVREKPDNDGYLDTLGFVVYKQGQHDNAVDIFQKAVKKQPNQGVFRYHLALALLAKGDQVQAKRELEQAVRQNLLPADKKKAEELLSSGLRAKA